MNARDVPSPAFTLATGRQIGGEAPVFIAAEIGINHDGQVEKAQRLIDVAAEAGADAVKLQILDPDNNYAPDHPSYALYQRMNLGMENYRRLAAQARTHGLVLFATPDTPSLSMVTELSMPLVKVSSGMLTDLPHLERACSLGVPVILSTGMSYLDEVIRSVQWCRDHGCRDLAVLQCSSLYPAPPESLNLAALDALRAATDAVVGFSDHSEGFLACAAAVARGAKVIEKHLTLDRQSPGPEHHFAADPGQLAELVRCVRTVERMMGHGRKEPSPGELANRATFRRCIVARRDIQPGEPLTRDNIAILRPSPGSRGLEPAAYHTVLGLTATATIPQGAGITREVLAGPPTGWTDATSTCRLRLAGSEDIQRIWRLANDPEARRYAFHPEPISWEEHERWYAQRLADPRCLIAVLELDDHGPVGQVRFEQREEGIEIDITVDPAWRGRGIGKELLTQGMQLAFSRWSQGTELLARVLVGNAASIRLFEACGFAQASVGNTHGREYVVLTRPLGNPSRIPEQPGRRSA